MTCKTCRYRDKKTNECRFDPPLFDDHASEFEKTAIWPTVAETDWCGKHDNGMPL